MENMNDNTIANYKKRNRKLFVLYKTLANDLLFYYTIAYLFLSNVKGLSTSQIVFAEAFYPIFKLIFQFPCTILIQKIEKKKSLLIANFSVAIYLFSILLVNSTLSLVIANIFCALGFVIKGIAESNFLYDSLDDTETKKEDFSKIEGKSSSRFFFFDAITAFITGFLYIINPYIPLLLSCLCMLISILIVFSFKEISNSTVTKNNKNSFFKEIHSQISDTFNGFKYITKSNRLRALILFNALFVTLLILMVTLHKSILDDVGVSSEYFGIIFAIMGIVISYSSNRSVFIHKKYHNKTLSILGISLTLSIIITGLCTIINLPDFWMYFILLLMIAISYIVKGPHYVLIKQYLNSFCDSDMRVKIYSANLFFEYITTATISMISSLLLNYFSNSFTTLIIGIVSFVLMILLIKYMSTRVGLNPEEYSEKDTLVK